jgi:hypothetical protein
LNVVNFPLIHVSQSQVTQKRFMSFPTHVSRFAMKILFGLKLALVSSLVSYSAGSKGVNNRSKAERFSGRINLSDNEPHSAEEKVLSECQIRLDCTGDLQL